MSIINTLFFLIEAIIILFATFLLFRGRRITSLAKTVSAGSFLAGFFIGLPRFESVQALAEMSQVELLCAVVCGVILNGLSSIAFIFLAPTLVKIRNAIDNRS